MLNRYIGGERKRAQATDLRGIEFVMRNTVSSRIEASRLGSDRRS